VQALNHGLHGHATLGVRLRIEKQLGMHHMICGSTLEIRPGHVVKILLMQKHAGARIVNVQEALQIRESVGSTQGFDTVVGQRHLIALGQGKNHLGLQRPFDVDVQFGFGHGPQQCRQTFGRDGVNFEHGGPRQF